MSSRYISVCLLCCAFLVQKSLSLSEGLLKGRQASNNNSTTKYRYYNNRTAPYLIESWPDVTWDAGEFYSGSVSIDESNPNRTLFFVFKPSESDVPVDEVTIWLNGGPGCSSLEGFFQENGPILWQPGTSEPMQNPYAWSTITNMLWVEQPVGTGFTQGEITAHNERDVANDFIRFFKNWQILFGIEKYKIYVTGESYAGRYVPYISAAMLDQNDKRYYDLSGNLMYDPTIGEFDVVQTDLPMYPFAHANNGILNLNQSFMEQLRSTHEKCGYAAYIERYLVFPPTENQPVISLINYDAHCSTFFTLETAALELNPCFELEHITNYCPLLWDVLSYPTKSPGVPSTPYFNRTDVKEAMHAPLDTNWEECYDGRGKSVFVHTKNGSGSEGDYDLSLDPIQNVLPKVIEATNRVLVSNAQWDANILTNGTMLAIQNMTWNGLLGFQSAPNKDFYVAEKELQYGHLPHQPNPQGTPQGIMGKQHFERGLMWVETYQSGHMQPQYQPRAALTHLKWLLGRIENFDVPS